MRAKKTSKPSRHSAGYRTPETSRGSGNGEYTNRNPTTCEVGAPKETESEDRLAVLSDKCDAVFDLKNWPALGSWQQTPLGGGNAPLIFEIVSEVELAPEVDLNVDRGVDGNKSLKILHQSKLKRRLLVSSQR